MNHLEMSSSKVVFIKGFFNQSLPDLHDRLRADGSGLAWFGVMAMAPEMFKTIPGRFTSPNHDAINQKQKIY